MSHTHTKVWHKYGHKRKQAASQPNFAGTNIFSRVNENKSCCACSITLKQHKTRPFEKKVISKARKATNIPGVGQPLATTRKKRIGAKMSLAKLNFIRRARKNPFFSFILIWTSRCFSNPFGLVPHRKDMSHFMACDRATLWVSDWEISTIDRAEATSHIYISLAILFSWSCTQNACDSNKCQIFHAKPKRCTTMTRFAYKTRFDNRLHSEMLTTVSLRHNLRTAFLWRCETHDLAQGAQHPTDGRALFGIVVNCLAAWKVNPISAHLYVCAHSKTDNSRHCSAAKVSKQAF